MSQNREPAVETAYLDGKVTLRRSDGSHIVTFSVDPESASGGEPSDAHIPTLYKYNYNTNPAPPPASSQVRSDTTDASTTSMFFVHRMDNDNKDEKYLLMLAKAGDKLFVQDTNNSDSHGLFLLTSDPVDNGAYITFNVEVHTSSGVPLAGSGVMIGIVH